MYPRKSQRVIVAGGLLVAIVMPISLMAQKKENRADHPKVAQSLRSTPDPNTMNYTTSWVGNSLPGNGSGTVDALQHVPLDADGMYVTPDGKVYTNTAWDEGGRPVSVFKNGQLISPLNDEDNSPNWSNGGGDAIAADAKYIYKGNSANGTNGGQGITVLNASDLTAAPVTFTGSSTLGNSYAVNGIAISKGKIYVTEEDQNVVDIFDQNTLALIKSLSINNPARIAVDDQGGLWVSHHNEAAYPNLNGNPTNLNEDYGLPTVDHFDSGGNLINTITLPGNAEVSALWIDHFGFLLVGDEGPDQNIKVYANLAHNPTLVKTLGVKGGVYGGDLDDQGKVGPLRFRGITGIGTDNLNNLYVSQNGWGFAHGNGHGTEIESYKPSGQRNWSVKGLEFVHTMDADPITKTDVYDPYHHFKVDYQKPAGRESTYVADTLNRFRYPDDVRITGIAATAQVQYIQGRKFLLVGNQGGVDMAIYRFDDSASGPGKEIAIPCAAFDYGSFLGSYQDFDVQPLDGEFIWRDSNGDGRIQMNEFLEPPNNLHRDGGNFWMDSNGDVWQVNYQAENPPYEQSIHLRRYLFQGFDSFGAPIYDYDHMTVYNVPNDFADIPTIAGSVFRPNESEGGTLYVSGGSPSAGSFSQIVRYDNWDKGNRKARWVINVPFDPDPNNTWSPVSFSQAGKFIFVDFNTPHYALIYSAVDGSYVGEFTPGSDVGGLPNVGNDDEWQSTHALALDSGEYILFKEEDFQAKQLMYKWRPPSELTKIPAPAPPTDVTASPDDQSVTLSWTGGAGALVHTVSRSTTQGGPYTPVDSGIYGNTVSDTGLSNGTTYYYVVSSLSETGTSLNSPEVAVTPTAAGTTYEAESGLLAGGPFVVAPCSLCSGNARVGDVAPGSTITLTGVTVPISGTYSIRIYDVNGNQPSDWGLPQEPTIDIAANGGTEIVSPPLPYTGNWNTPGYTTVEAPLNAGSNTVVLSVPADAPTGDPDIDRIVVSFKPM